MFLCFLFFSSLLFFLSLVLLFFPLLLCISKPILYPPECTKIARFSAVAAAIFTAPGKIARLFEAPRCAISSAKKTASEPRFFLRWKQVKMILAAEFPAIPSSAIKIASERRCAILVHSGTHQLRCAAFFYFLCFAMFFVHEDFSVFLVEAATAAR